MKKSLLALVTLFAAVALQAQTIIYVKPDATGTGSSWQNACNLECVLGNGGGTCIAPTGTDVQIWIQAGTYYPSGMLTIPALVKVYGGFVGTEEDLTERDFSANPTIIDAQQKFGSVFRMETYAVLDGFTIKNGSATGNPQKNGGGVWASEYCAIENCIIIQNTALARGGGIYAAGELTLVNSTVENNTATGKGSDMYGDCIQVATAPIPMSGCNQEEPLFGSTLGTVTFAEPTEYPISGNGINQIWSSAVTATNCDKTTYNGGTTGYYNADCRSNPEYPGDLFSWCAVARFVQELCPVPWRVPTAKDFDDLNKAFGGPGGMSSYADPNMLDSYINVWGGFYGGQSDTPGRLVAQGVFAYFWSQTEHDANSGIITGYQIQSVIYPQSAEDKNYGFSVRCVRDL